MEYLEGYTVKPYNIDMSGEVFFTDGTNNDLMVNQNTCEAYGYTFDSSTGVCRSYRVTENLNFQALNGNNKINGGGNITQVGCNNIQVNGMLNNLEGNNTNCLVNGSANTLGFDVKDATVLGAGANSHTNGELALGGGHNDLTGAYADRKMSIVNLSGVSTDGDTYNLTVNGDGRTFINIKNNSIVGFEMYVTRLEVAGSAATPGNYSYANVKGAVQIDNDYNMSFVVGFTRNIAKIGVNGSKAMIDSSTTDVKSMTIQVSDRNNVTNIWSATVYVHELVSTAVSF